MRSLSALITTVSLLCACNQPSAPASSSPSGLPVRAEAPTLSHGSGGVAAAAFPAAAAAAPASHLFKENLLGLKEPNVNKSVPNWKYGVPAPDPFPASFDPKKDYFATLHTTLGDLTVKFFPEVAPRHVTSFIYLSEIGFYDDVPFHRICTHFMAQGGDPSGQGTGGPAYRIPAEFNEHLHKRGVLSMARTMDPNSAGSQFFLMFTDYPSLDHQYSVFGQVQDGEATLKKFEDVSFPGSMSCPPKQPVSIKSVDIFTKPKKG